MHRRRAGWRTGNNVNMAIGQGDVLVTPLQLASAYATLGNGGTRWVPQVVREIRDGGTGEAKRTIEPVQAGHVDDDARVAPGDHRRPHRRDHPRGRHRRRRVQRLPERRLPDRRQDRHRAGERQGARPRCSARSVRPPTRSFAISVFMEESGYGGVGRRAGGPPPVRRAVRLDAAAARAPTGGQVPELAELSPDPGDVRD